MNKIQSINDLPHEEYDFEFKFGKAYKENILSELESNSVDFKFENSNSAAFSLVLPPDPYLAQWVGNRSEVIMDNGFYSIGYFFSGITQILMIRLDKGFCWSCTIRCVSDTKSFLWLPAQ